MSIVENQIDRTAIKGIAILESALKTSPATVVVAEPFLFNLCTFIAFRFELLN